MTPLDEMPICFVIQPFGDAFDKRYREVYKPALEDAGLEPYRVDEDPSTERLIDSIEEKIRRAAICLADVSTNNPNVWYELGYAFAVGRSVVMVCSRKERKGVYPFDIQHRAVIEYDSESPSDFQKLRDDISTRAKVYAKKSKEQPTVEAQEVAQKEDVKPIRQNLTREEISVLDVTASKTTVPGTSVSAWSVREKARASLPDLSITMALHVLRQRGIVEIRHGEDDSGQYDETITVTESGWTWINNNSSLFFLSEEDIPF